MADLRSEATPPEQSQDVIRKNKDSLSRAISKRLIFVLRILSVSLITCLAGVLLREREKPAKACAKRQEASVPRMAGVKKRGGGGVGRGIGERKKRELRREGKGSFSFRAFLSLPFLCLSCKLRRTRPNLLATSVLICALDK